MQPTPVPVKNRFESLFRIEKLSEKMANLFQIPFLED